MKTIELNTAAVDNAGRRIEAGARPSVGTRPGQIDVDRATALVARAGASVIGAKKLAAKATISTKKKVVPKRKVQPKPLPSTGAPAEGDGPPEENAKP